MRRGTLLAVAAAAISSWAGGGLLAPVSAGAAPATLNTGFNDGYLSEQSDPGLWLRTARGHGARDLRIIAGWALASPTRPPTEAAARDPLWDGYRFATMDASVRNAVAAGLRPLVMVYSAPAWAEAPGRPAAARAGTWKPDAAAYGRFMQAVAKRYDGTTPDPTRPGSTLPRVQAFQVWNEPNLTLYLTPQWTNGKPTAPRIYRALQNEAYAGIKAGQRGATVVGTGMAPFGDRKPGQARMQPARFWRETLCLDQRLRRTCSATTKMDVITHHPYATARTPSSRTASRDDISIGDTSELVDIARAARQQRTLGPKTPKLWITEFGIQSNPPVPKAMGGLTLAAQARYLVESTWLLWRQGAQRLFYFTIVDDRAGLNGEISYGVGVYQQNGKAKPAALAVEFPVFAYRSGGKLAVWTRPVASGRLRVQALRGSSWRTVKTISARVDGPRTVKIDRAGVRAVRATVGGRTSYVWRVR
jgi:hypothetical protein